MRFTGNITGWIAGAMVTTITSMVNEIWPCGTVMKARGTLKTGGRATWRGEEEEAPAGFTKAGLLTRFQILSLDLLAAATGTQGGWRT